MDFQKESFPRTPSTLSPRSPRSSADTAEYLHIGEESPHWMDLTPPMPAAWPGYFAWCPEEAMPAYSSSPTLQPGGFLWLAGEGLSASMGYNEFAFAGDGPSPWFLTDDRDSEESELCSNGLRSGSELLEMLQAGEDVVAMIFGRVVELACTDKAGSLAVQHALNDGTYDVKIQMVNEMRGHIVEMIWSMHGNYVVAAAIESLPEPNMDFIIDEILPLPDLMAAHRYGIRILHRLLAAQFRRLGGLLDAIVDKTSQLSLDKYGNYTIQNILTECPSYRSRIVASLLQHNAMVFALDQYGSNVVQKALQISCSEDQELLAMTLLRCQESLAALRSNQNGLHVLQVLEQLYPVVIVNLEASAPWHSEDALLDACKYDRWSWAAHVGALLRIALINKRISRKLQDMVNKASAEDPDRCAAVLLSQLDSGGRVLAAVTSPHANFLVERACHDLPKRFAQRVATSLLACGAFGKDSPLQVSRNQFGYRVVQALIRRLSGEPLKKIAEELLVDAVGLAFDVYGNYVLQDVIRKCSKSEFEKIAEALQPHATNLAEDQYGRYVLQVLLQQKRKANSEHIRIFRQASRSKTQ